MAKAAPAKKAPSKSEVYQNIAQATGLKRKDVAGVFDALATEVKKAMGNRGPGLFQIPGLVKIIKRKTPAKPAIKGWKNPFTGEIQDKPAQPAKTKVAVRALKNLKSMV